MKRNFTMKALFAVMMILVLTFTAAFAEYEGDAALALSPEFYLNGNPTTGYTWTASVEDEDTVSVLMDYHAESDLLGAGGTYWFRFDGIQEGFSEITLSYARTGSEQAMYTIVFHVRVDADLNVVIWQTDMNLGA
ncbi:MAG: protease inhibitor I42 family protein [Clostridia bacterium]|nr:protease inhibitor I42 family protein [Clostridia bacterium]MBQ4158799.1 protease inhibitor I42 family protein [Clostridia bacterium]